MADTSTEKLISESPFFAGLEPTLIGFLAEHAHRKRVEADEILFRYGDSAHHFYLIVDGTVAVEVAAIEGPPLELQRLGAGAVLGWSWLIRPYRWSFQGRAITGTDVIVFDGTAVLAACEENSKFGYELLKRFSTLMSERLGFARRKMMEEWKPPGFA